MKYIMMLAGMWTGMVYGQDETTPELPSRTVFKLSPFHFTQNTLKVGIENFSADRTKSLSIYAGVRTNSDTNGDLYSDDGYDGVLGEIQFKKYVLPMKEYTSKKNNTYVQGVYAGMFVQGGSYAGDHHFREYNYDPNTGASTTTDYNYTEDVWNAALGFTLGAQRVFWNTLFVDVYIGGGIQIANSSTSGQMPPQNSYYYYRTSFDPPYEGIIPKIGIQIGVGL